jgi:hypothetical protein
MVVVVVVVLLLRASLEFWEEAKEKWKVMPRCVVVGAHKGQTSNSWRCALPSRPPYAYVQLLLRVVIRLSDEQNPQGGPFIHSLSFFSYPLHSSSALAAPLSLSNFLKVEVEEEEDHKLYSKNQDEEDQVRDKSNR